MDKNKKKTRNRITPMSDDFVHISSDDNGEWIENFPSVVPWESQLPPIQTFEDYIACQDEWEQQMMINYSLQCDTFYDIVQYDKPTKLII